MASGDTLIIFPAQSFVVGASDATHDSRNLHPVVDFDTTTNEDATAKAIIPQHYDGGGYTVLSHWTMDTATTGDIDVDIAWEDDTAFNITSDGFAAVRSIDGTTVPGTAGITFIITHTFTEAQADNVVAGEMFRLRVTRDTADTAAGDAELHMVEVRET